jgi:hypothetical protein
LWFSLLKIFSKVKSLQIVSKMGFGAIVSNKRTVQGVKRNNGHRVSLLNWSTCLLLAYRKHFCTPTVLSQLTIKNQERHGLHQLVHKGCELTQINYTLSSQHIDDSLTSLYANQLLLVHFVYINCLSAFGDQNYIPRNLLQSYKTNRKWILIFHDNIYTITN